LVKRGKFIGSDGKLSNSPGVDQGFEALAKALAGFANAEGGLLILGVREKPEKINGRLVKIRPGGIYALPLGTVTKEMIESKLRTLIQFPIDDLTIVPLRLSNRSNRDSLEHLQA
jgi:predicted HTH transcriptional regulator